MSTKILEGDCRETLRMLPDSSVHCCVTSPPYFGLRDYGHGDQIGLEDTPAEFVQQMVKVFREVKRVLRDDGILWLNLGDSYAGSWGAQSRANGNDQNSSLQGGSMLSARQIKAGPHTTHTGSLKNTPGLKPKDLIGIPWRVAFALQEDGWFLRQDIIWHKPNPMPESVTDRCTKAHEYLFLLAKSERYFFDGKAIQEASSTNDQRPVNGSPGIVGRPMAAKRGSGNKERKPASARGVPVDTDGKTSGAVAGSVPWEGDTRNKRSVWTVTTKPHKGAHFATFPPDLIRPCILAGTSEVGCCPHCGAPWKRIIEKEFIPQADVCDEKRAKKSNKGMDASNGWGETPRGSNKIKTTGWQPTCKCAHTQQEAIPCTVLDPFGGSGTTAEVARDCGCKAILCELNPAYVKLIRKRLQQRTLLEAMQ